MYEIDRQILTFFWSWWHHNSLIWFFSCLYFGSNFESNFESDFGSDNLISLSHSKAAFSANLFVPGVTDEYFQLAQYVLLLPNPNPNRIK